MELDEIRPVTASPLSKTWLRMTGRDQWKETPATVFSCDWRPFSDEGLVRDVGWHEVVYSYTINGERYIGKFLDYGQEDEDYFKRDDTFEICYNPAKPTKSYYPELRTRTRFLLISISVGAFFAIIIMILKFFVLNKRH
jgi:hypothetical protein